jgi:hypothetical protein
MFWINTRAAPATVYAVLRGSLALTTPCSAFESVLCVVFSHFPIFSGGGMCASLSANAAVGFSPACPRCGAELFRLPNLEV